MNTIRIIEKVDLSRFESIIDKYKLIIQLSHHALDHLSAYQRKVFKKEDLINTVIKEKPILVGLQSNGRYALFYRRKWGYLKLIISITDVRLEIITFINTENMPNLEKL